VTESQRLWRMERFKSGIGTGVIYKGHLYSMSQDGIASCTELQSGKTVWEERLKSSASRGSSWSSMLLAGDRIYVPNQNGDVFVFRAGPTFELLSTNSVGESTNASLAAADGAIFMRTDKALYCFKEGK
jgi:outer membrane protein assembly factor BamB